MKNNKDLEAMSVVEKRQLIREYIKDGSVSDITSSDTNSLNSNDCDSIIIEADNNRNLNSNPVITESNSNNDNNEIANALSNLSNLISKQSNSGSDPNLAKKVEQLSDHCDILGGFITDANNKINNIDNLLDNLLKSPNVKKNIKVIQAKVTGDNPMLNAITKYYAPNCEANTNIMLLSPPSFGKSHSIRILGSTYDNFLEHNCSSDIDEITTLLGNIIPDSSGSGFVNVDGILTQAMRDASNNKSVLLFLDEILRWNENTQAFLLTFLNGFEKEVNGIKEKWFRLTTRKNENGSLEVIEANAKNLHIISGANLTSELPIQAFWSRFRKVRFDFSKRFAKSTAKSILGSYDIEEKDQFTFENFLDGFSDLMLRSRDLVLKGALQFPIDFRNLKASLDSLDENNFKDLWQNLVIHSIDDCTVWNPDSGDTLEDSRSELADTIGDVYKKAFEKKGSK